MDTKKPETVDTIGPSLTVGLGEETEADWEGDPAWERVHAWKAKYFSQHGRMPRHGLIMRQLRAERAKERAC
jgi:hypothetical protein